MNVVGLVALAGCAAHGLTLSQAKQLALAAPNIENAVRLNHAAPRFEYIKAQSGGWYFDINSANPCPRQRPCSKLLGHYTVDKRTGEVTELDRGEEGVAVTSHKMIRLKRLFLARACHQRI